MQRARKAHIAEVGCNMDVEAGSRNTVRAGKPAMTHNNMREGLCSWLRMGGLLFRAYCTRVLTSSAQSRGCEEPSVTQKNKRVG
jgi:hypothetical protein